MCISETSSWRLNAQYHNAVPCTASEILWRRSKSRPQVRRTGANRSVFERRKHAIQFDSEQIVVSDHFCYHHSPTFLSMYVCSSSQSQEQVLAPSIVALATARFVLHKSVRGVRHCEMPVRHLLLERLLALLSEQCSLFNTESLVKRGNFL